MDNTPERLTIVNRLRDLLAEDVPQILTFHKAFYSVSQPWALRTSDNLLLEGALKYQQVNPEMRTKLQAEWNHAPKWPMVLVGAFFIGALGYAVHINRQRNI